MNPKTPLRVSFMSMTRSEAIVATMVLLESFTEVDPAAESLPSGLFIGAGPGPMGRRGVKGGISVSPYLVAIRIAIYRESLRSGSKNRDQLRLSHNPVAKACHSLSRYPAL